MNGPRIIRGTADSIGDVGAYDFVVLQASRREIDEQNISSMLERLLSMSDNKETVLKLRERVFLHFEGFEHDAREICEIPEIRSFMKALVDQWPHWFWFLSRQEGTLSLLMSLLCQVKIHRQGARFGVEFTNLEELRAVFDDLATRSVIMFQIHEIAPKDAVECMESAAAALGG